MNVPTAASTADIQRAPLVRRSLSPVAEASPLQSVTDKQGSPTHAANGQSSAHTALLALGAASAQDAITNEQSRASLIVRLSAAAQEILSKELLGTKTPSGNGDAQQPHLLYTQANVVRGAQQLLPQKITGNVSAPVEAQDADLTKPLTGDLLKQALPAEQSAVAASTQPAAALMREHAISFHVVVNGQAWPGQPVHTEIFDAVSADEESPDNDPERYWSSHLRLSLPNLGTTDFHLSLRTGTVQVAVLAQPDAIPLFSGGLHELVSVLAEHGFRSPTVGVSSHG
jgi:hypothetical protein